MLKKECLSANDICDMIYNGSYNSQDLDSITTAIRTRREHLNHDMRNRLQIGQKVWFNQTVRPQYLRGAEAVVIKVNRERIEIELANGPAGRFRGGKLMAPISLLTTTKPSY